VSTPRRPDGRVYAVVPLEGDQPDRWVVVGVVWRTERGASLTIESEPLSWGERNGGVRRYVLQWSDTPSRDSSSGSS
jgi:hypothetical protein